MQNVGERAGYGECTVGLSYALIRAVQGVAPIQGYFLLFPAIFLAAVVFDRGSGFLAVGLSTLLLSLDPHVSEQARFTGQHLFSLSLFAVVGFCLAAVSEGLRLGWERAVKAEKEKAILLRELQHRTKNDFAMAAAVLRLQATSKPDKEVQTALQSAIGRIETLGQAHQQFDLSENGIDIPMRTYLAQLCRSLSARLNDANIEVRVEVEDLTLPPKHANTIGLICNELLTNACKHAFEDRQPGIILVEFSQPEAFILAVEDNGKGCPPDAKDGVGSQVVRLLVRQLDGEIERHNLKKGCRVSVTIPPAALTR